MGDRAWTNLDELVGSVTLDLETLEPLDKVDNIWAELHGHFGGDALLCAQSVRGERHSKQTTPDEACFNGGGP